MIRFIVIDNKEYIRAIVKKIIHCKMMKCNEEYKVYEYDDLDANLKECIKLKHPNQIYFIDVKLPSASGIDIAKRIRSLNDWNSIICFMSMYYNMSECAYKERLLITEFIWKKDNFEAKIADNIETALKILSNKRMLVFSSQKIKYRISLDEIISIERDTFERNLEIHTVNEKLRTNLTLNQIKKQLDDNFIFIQRGIIINKNFVSKIDFLNRLLFLNNNKITHYFAMSRAKELKERVIN